MSEVQHKQTDAPKDQTDMPQVGVAASQTSSTDRACESCHFFDTKTSTCRSGSPTSAPVQAKAVNRTQMWGEKDGSDSRETTDFTYRGVWPTVDNADWCGKYEKAFVLPFNFEGIAAVVDAFLRKKTEDGQPASSESAATTDAPVSPEVPSDGSKPTGNEPSADPLNDFFTLLATLLAKK